MHLLVAWQDQPTVMAWAGAWLERIGQLFDANKTRVQVRADPTAFAEQDRIVRAQVASMAQQRDAELHRADLHPACRKALESLGRHWAGLTVFVDHPEVPMDNNAAERSERGPAWAARTTMVPGALERPTGGVHVFDFADLAVVEPVVSALADGEPASRCRGGRRGAGQPGSLPAVKPQRAAATSWSLKTASKPAPPDGTS